MSRSRRLCWLPVAFCLTWSVCWAADVLAAGGRPTAEQLQFFEAKIRPILLENCHKCHSGAKPKGGLTLDQAEGAFAGGESGNAAIVPGKPEASLLVEAINRTSLEMPPDKKLTESEIAAITEWIRAGAAWPEESGTSASVRKNPNQISDEDRAHWAFQAIRMAPPPEL